MANILKRPMFRRGGSAAYDVGITSGLEPRKKYQVGGMSLEGYPYNVDVEEDEDVSLDNTEMNMSDNTGITSIGGGYGGMCAILNCLAKNKKIKIDEYAIYDLNGVQEFQNYYLNQVKLASDIGINSVCFLDSKDLDAFNGNYDYLISFYALGEFDDTTKYAYINKVISKVKNGFILWNPHRSKDEIGEKLLLRYHPNAMVKKEDPLTSDHNLEIII